MPTIPENQFVKIANVMNMTSLSRPQIYAMERDGNFPRRIPYTGTLMSWTSRHIRDWMQSRLDARQPHQAYPHALTIELPDRFISKKQLLKMVPLDEDTILKEERRGRFPTRLRISLTRIAWLEREITLWRETRFPADKTTV